MAIGGDGSLRVARRLADKGLRVVGVPKTIDNDLEETVITFGFDSAVSFATDCIDRLHTTAASHQRVMVVEVMGRYAGWIALNCGVSGDAHAILIPEIPYDIGKVAAALLRREREGAQHSIVVAAEGAAPSGGKASTIEKRIGRPERLGGIGERVAGELAVLTGKETRHVVLGHLLRGGAADHVRPVAVLALRRRRGARARRGTLRRDGRSRPADGALRAARESHAAHEVGAGRLRHHSHRARPRHLLRGLR